MDKASIIGILIGASALGFVFFEVSHGNLLMFYSLEGVLMVGFGSVSVVFIAMPMNKLLQVPGYIKTFLFQKGMSANEVIQTVQSLSDKARRDGILALEPEIAKIKDPFLAAGLKMAIDGVEPASIEATLRMEILAMTDRHKAGKKFFDLIKLYGPGYGLVGTLVGQVGMFGQLASADIGALGHALAIAVVATMYGAIVANAIAGPIGDKLGIKSGEEILNREMMVQAILSVQAGDNPRVTLDKMLAFIPSVRRDPFRAAA
ncbi:MAG: MotA/TolQ/ExbB proton channel family protein [Phycisphaerales bacterium]|nr:MotA/TolQ/ExbB proton channel family protein [Phycisphaerales bacterium]